MEEEQINSTEEKKKNAFLSFLWKYKTIVAFIVIVGGGLLYLNFKISSIESSHRTEIESTVNTYNLKLDSLQIAGVKQTVKVFSWAVRSELIRNNIEQVNQFFLAFIKEKGVEQIDLVNPKSALVILSTDKKQEGMKIRDTYITQAENTIIQEDSLGIKIISPIMGLEKKIGIISVSIKK